MKSTLSNPNTVRHSNNLDASRNAAFTICPEGAKTLARIARSSIYSNAIQAVVREYICNAFDANVQAGNEHLPIDVRIDTNEVNNEYTFSVRDYGPGLSFKELQSIYVLYGMSTKRDSDAVVGNFGIGCKSGFAYATQFQVISYLNGVRSTYIAFLNNDDDGELQLLFEDETTEANGICIRIAIKDKQDVSTFKWHILTILTHSNRRFRILPDTIESFRVATEIPNTYIYSDNEVSLSIEPDKELSYIILHKHNIFSNHAASYASTSNNITRAGAYNSANNIRLNVIGVTYPIEQESYAKLLALVNNENHPVDDPIANIFRQTLDFKQSVIVINVPPEFVSIAASREICFINPNYFNEIVTRIHKLKYILIKYALNTLESLVLTDYNEQQIFVLWLALLKAEKFTISRCLPKDKLEYYSIDNLDKYRVVEFFTRGLSKRSHLDVENLLSTPKFVQLVNILRIIPNLHIEAGLHNTLNITIGKCLFRLKNAESTIFEPLLRLRENFTYAGGSVFCITGRNEIIYNSILSQDVGIIYGSSKTEIYEYAQFMKALDKINHNDFVKGTSIDEFETATELVRNDSNCNDYRVDTRCPNIFSKIIGDEFQCLDVLDKMMRGELRLKDFLDIPIVVIDNQAEFTKNPERSRRPKIIKHSKCVKTETALIEAKSLNLLVSNIRYSDRHLIPGLQSLQKIVIFHVDTEKRIDIANYRKNFKYGTVYSAYEIDTLLANFYADQTSKDKKETTADRKQRLLDNALKLSLGIATFLEFRRNSAYALKLQRNNTSYSALSRSEISLKDENVFYVEKEAFERHRKIFISSFWDFFNISKIDASIRIVVVGKDAVTTINKSTSWKHYTSLMDTYIACVGLDKPELFAKAMFRYFLITDNYDQLLLNICSICSNIGDPPNTVKAHNKLAAPLVDYSRYKDGYSNTIFNHIPPEFLETIFDLYTAISPGEFRDFLTNLLPAVPIIKVQQICYQDHIRTLKNIGLLFPQHESVLIAYAKAINIDNFDAAKNEVEMILSKYAELSSYFKKGDGTEHNFRSTTNAKLVIKARLPLIVSAIDEIFRNNSLIPR